MNIKTLNIRIKTIDFISEKAPRHMYMYLCLLKAKWWCVRSENKAILTLKKNISFYPFSRKVSVGECPRVSVSFLKKIV